MAKRFIDTELDDKPWFTQLPCRLKCAVQYVFRKCDQAGIWEPNYLIAAAYIGEGGFTEAELLGINEGEQFEKLPDGKIFVTGFCDFQYGTLSEDCKPHRPVIQKLKKYDLYERVLKGFRKGIENLQEKDKEKEKDKETDKEKDFGKSENLLTDPLIVPAMLQVWKQKFPKYTSDPKYDHPAIGKILLFMMEQNGNYQPDDSDNQTLILNTFQLIADQVNREPFWLNKPLKSIAEHIQEFYNKIKNPQNGKTHSTKSSPEALKQKLTERYGNR